MLERTRVVGSGLAVRPKRCCANGGLWSEAHHCVDVARGLGVMREPIEIPRFMRLACEHAQGFVVQVQPAVRSYGLLDRKPRQLVAETDARRVGDEHA